MPTLLVSPRALAAEEVGIEGDAYRHLFRSRRLAAGSRVRVVDGEGRARWGVVTRVDRRRGIAALGAPAPANEPWYQLRLVVCAPRPERASWLVEKATEIGVVAIAFSTSERSPRSYGEAQLDRFRRVARAAVEQSHRSLAPEISGVHPWSDVPDLLGRDQPDTERFVLTPAGAPAAGIQPRSGRDANPESPKHGCLVIGPEGGLDEQEIHQLIDEMSCRPISLGERILRVETAAVVGASWLLLTRDTYGNPGALAGGGKELV